MTIDEQLEKLAKDLDETNKRLKLLAEKARSRSAQVDELREKTRDLGKQP
jgi:uncharacterized coiled-coil DUF342 family protein